MAFDVKKTSIEITAVDKTKVAFDSVKSSIGGLTSQFGALTGILSAGAFVAFTKRIIDQADSMNDLSKRTGIAMEQIGAWKLATEQSGTSMDALTQALGKGSKYLVEHGDNLKKIGINAKTSEELILQLSGIISKMPSDDPRRTALAMQVLGKSAGELIPLLSEGEAGLRAMLERGRELNPVTKEMAEEADKFNDNLAEMKLISSGLFVNLVGSILPSFNTYLKQLKLIVDEGDWMDKLLFFTLGYVPGKIADKTEDPSVQIKRYTQHIIELKKELAGLPNDISGFGNARRTSLEKELAQAQAGLAAQRGRFIYSDAHNAALARSPGLDDAAVNSVLNPDAAINAKKLADEAKKAAKTKLDLEEKRFEMANDIEKQLSKQEIAHAKLVDELAKKNAKTKLEMEQKQFDMSNDIFKQMSQRELEHEKLVREAQKKTFDKNMELWNSIEGTAHKVWTDVWEGGSNAFKNIGKTIKSAILDLLYQMTFKKWILNIGAVFSASGSGSAAASLINGVTGEGAAGGVGGISSVFSAGKGIFDLISGGNAAIVSSIESLGTFLSTGTGGLGDMLGGALGQYAGQISNVLPFAGAALNLLSGNVSGAIGSAIGAALTFTPLGPVGGIIGSFLGSALGGLFGGGKLPPRVGTQRIGNYQNGTFSASQGANAKLIPGLGDSLDNLNETFSKVLGSFFKAFDIEANIGTVSLLAKKKRPQASFQAIVNGVQTGFYNEKFGKKTDLNAALSALSEHALGDVLAQAIRASSVSDGVKKFFDNLTKKEDVLAAVNTLGTLNQALKDLPPVFDAIRNAIETTSYKTSIADLNARFAALNTYTSLFYTQQEQFDTFTKQLTSQFDALNTALPKSRDEYRKLVDGIKVTDESTSNLFHGLVALAPAMDSFFKQIESLTNVVSRDSFNSLLDAQRYAGVAANYGSTFASDYTGNVEAGRIMVGQNGVATTASGNTDLLGQVKLLRTAIEAVAVNTSNQLSELRKWYATSLNVTVVTP